MSSIDVHDAEVGVLIERSRELSSKRDAWFRCMSGELVEVCEEIEKDIDNDTTVLRLLEGGNVHHDLGVKLLCSVYAVSVSLF